MSIDDIVQLTIVVSSATLSRPGFGIPMALVTSVPAGFGAAKVRTFSKLSELTDMGFTSAHPAYVMASRMKSQSPAPKTFMIAVRNAARRPAQSLQLKCMSAVEGDVYKVSLGIGGGAVTEISYTVLAAATTTTVATAIELLIEAVTGIASSSATNVITLTPVTAGDLINVKDWATDGHAHFELTDATPDPGVADDLDDVLDANGSWYGVLLDSNSEAEVKAAAAWTEANEKLFAYSTSDTGSEQDAVTTDLASDLKLLAYDRTFGIYNANELLAYSAAAWMARGFAFDPGKITWAYKDLKGIAYDALSTGKQTALEAKNLNFYVEKYSAPITWEGKVASGEWIDTIHGLDWLSSELKLQVFAAIQSLPKLPYTIAGLGVLEGTVKSVLKAGTRVGLLVDDETLTVTMPTLSEIDAVTKSQRLVPDIAFTATLAGAIHKTKADGLIKN